MKKFHLVLEDGTCVEDEEYLKTLPDHTVLVLVKDGQTYSGGKI